MDRNRPVCLWERLNGHPSWQKSWRGTTALTAYFNVCLIKSIQQWSLCVARPQIYLLEGEARKADTSRKGENNVTRALWLQHNMLEPWGVRWGFHWTYSLWSQNNFTWLQWLRKRHSLQVILHPLCDIFMSKTTYSDGNLLWNLIWSFGNWAHFIIMT